MRDFPEDDREQMAWKRSDDDIDEDYIEDEVIEQSDDSEVTSYMADRAPHVSVKSQEQDIESDLVDDVDDEDSPQAIYVGPKIETPEFDPVYAWMIVSAISIGLLPLEANVRYVVLWVLLGAIGLIGYMLGNSARLTDTSQEDLRIGIGLGVAIGLPMTILLGGSLKTVSERMFDVNNVPTQVMDTWVAMAVLFVLPAVESLFFRGIMQQIHNMLFTTVLATGWSMVLFYPHMSLGSALGVAISIAMLFGLLNFLYAYVRHRNGLAAAWSCQIIAGGLVWFVPRILF